MIEIVGALSTMTVPEVVTLLTTLVALIVAMERLVRTLMELVRLLLHGDYGPNEP